MLFFAVFRLLTADEVATRDLIVGVIVAAVLWQILQHLGGFYVEHVVRHAKDTSGLFAFVLGLLTWLYLGGQVTLIAAEVNVVRAKRLWPRKLFGEDSDSPIPEAIEASAGPMDGAESPHASWRSPPDDPGGLHATFDPTTGLENDHDGAILTINS